MNDDNTKAVYDFIQDYLDGHEGYPPSVREMAAGAYLAPSTVIRHLDKLEAWGLIRREPGLPRSVRLTGKPWPSDAARKKETNVRTRVRHKAELLCYGRVEFDPGTGRRGSHPDERHET